MAIVSVEYFRNFKYNTRALIKKPVISEVALIEKIWKIGYLLSWYDSRIFSKTLSIFIMYSFTFNGEVLFSQSTYYAQYIEIAALWVIPNYLSLYHYNAFCQSSAIGKIVYYAIDKILHVFWSWRQISRQSGSQPPVIKLHDAEVWGKIYYGKYGKNQ